MNIHIWRIKFASTRNSGSQFLGSKLRFSFFPKSQKPCITTSMSVNINLALIRALYVSGGLIIKGCRRTSGTSPTLQLMDPEVAIWLFHQKPELECGLISSGNVVRSPRETWNRFSWESIMIIIISIIIVIIIM